MWIYLEGFPRNVGYIVVGEVQDLQVTPGRCVVEYDIAPCIWHVGGQAPCELRSLDSCKLVMGEIEHLKFAEPLQSSVWQMGDVILTQLEVDEVGECLGEDSWRYWMDEIETQIQVLEVDSMSK